MTDAFSVKSMSKISVLELLGRRCFLRFKVGDIQTMRSNSEPRREVWEATTNSPNKLFAHIV